MRGRTRRPIKAEQIFDNIIEQDQWTIKRIVKPMMGLSRSTVPGKWSGLKRRIWSAKYAKWNSIRDSSQVRFIEAPGNPLRRWADETVRLIFFATQPHHPRERFQVAKTAKRDYADAKRLISDSYDGRGSHEFWLLCGNSRPFCLSLPSFQFSTAIGLSPTSVRAGVVSLLTLLWTLFLCRSKTLPNDQHLQK